MEDLLHEIARYVALVIEAIAILVIAIGAVEALIATLRVMLGGHALNIEKRAVWLDFARWLVAGLTFQLAADIVQTTIAPTLGRSRPGCRHSRHPHVPHLLPRS
jgi:uncharacterized membrane protein